MANISSLANKLRYYQTKKENGDEFTSDETAELLGLKIFRDEWKKLLGVEAMSDEEFFTLVGADEKLSQDEGSIASLQALFKSATLISSLLFLL